MLEPQTVMITGLTRDGLLDEDGKLAGPVANFRYNESRVTVLENGDAMNGDAMNGDAMNGDAMTKQTWRAASNGNIWRVPRSERTSSRWLRSRLVFERAAPYRV